MIETRRRWILRAVLAAAPALVLPGLGLGQTPPNPLRPPAGVDLLPWLIENGPRGPKDKARDVWRHPQASMAFWGLKPGQTVIEITPGGGWWTAILAPYLTDTGGRYIAAVGDLNDPHLNDEGRKGRAYFEAKFKAHPEIYGDITLVGFGPVSGPLAPAGSVDMVLIARETHNWVKIPGFMQKALADCYAALKPGGVLAIEEHRAPDGADPYKGDGYLSEAYVIDQARRAGFMLAARSQINANPKDTKDYPFGVWTLPPTRLSAPMGQPPNPAFDHGPYDAIGESDRMTLKFVKPA